MCVYELESNCLTAFTSNILLNNAFLLFSLSTWLQNLHACYQGSDVCVCVYLSMPSTPTAQRWRTILIQFTAQLAVKFSDSYFPSSQTFTIEMCTSVSVYMCNCVCCCASAYEKGVNFLNGLKIGQFYSLMNKTFLFCNNYKHTHAIQETASPEDCHTYY